MTKQSKILAGVLAGVAVGAVVALAVGTDSKSEFKDKIGDWLCDLAKSSKDKFDDVANVVKDTVAKVTA